MADFPAPATANYQAPDGLTTLSNLMSLKQKQIAIAGQVSTNASAAAKAQGDTQDMQERQAISSMMKSGRDDKGESIYSPDPVSGKDEPDPAKILPALGRIAPKNGQAYAQSILKTQADKVGLRAASQSLDAQGRSMLMGPVQAAANDPGQSSSDINAGIDNLVAAHPEMANAANYLKNLTRHLDVIKDPKARAEAVQSMAARMQPGQAVPTLGTPTQIDRGGQIQPGVVAPAVAGGGFSPAGAPVTKTLTPGEQLPQPVQTPAGLMNRQPTTGALSPPAQMPGAAGAGAPANLNPSAGQAAFTAANAQGIGERVQQAQAAANGTIQTQDALGRAMTILDKPGAPSTGGGFDLKKDLANALSGLGFDTEGAKDANELVKNLARYESARATQAGLGHTDAARDLAHGGSPNTGTDNAALRDVVRQSLGTEKAVAAYARIQTGVTDPAKAATNEAAFRDVPHLIQTYEYTMMRNEKEADKFLADHGMTHADVNTSVAILKKLGAL
jgi:hypothetical protein